MIDAVYSSVVPDYSNNAGRLPFPLELDAAGNLKVNVVGGGFRSTSDSFVAAAAGDYADNDVLSDSASNGVGTALEFTNAVLTAGGSALVIGGSINVVASTSVAATIGLQLFSQTPTATELDDNAAEGGVGAADAPYYLGEMLFAAGTDYGAGTIKPPSAVTPAAPMMIRAAAGSKSIFGRLIFRDAEASETAGMPVHVILYMEG